MYAYENSTIANNTKYATLVRSGRAVLRERMIVYNYLPLAYTLSHTHSVSRTRCKEEEEGRTHSRTTRNRQQPRSPQNTHRPKHAHMPPFPISSSSSSISPSYPSPSYPILPSYPSTDPHPTTLNTRNRQRKTHPKTTHSHEIYPRPTMPEIREVSVGRVVCGLDAESEW